MESEDGWKVIHFQKTEQMRLVFEKSEFRTAYIMNEKVNGQFEWEPWPLGEDLPEDRHDVVTVCKSNDCNNVNTNSYMSSNWDRNNKQATFHIIQKSLLFGRGGCLTPTPSSDCLESGPAEHGTGSEVRGSN